MIDWLTASIERLLALGAALGVLMPSLIWADRRPARARERAAVQAQSLRRLDPRGLSPLAFERWCAEALKAQGWRCELTKASGDAGVDVVARKDAVTLAVQVKRWGKPVSLKAVQEVVAGKAMYGATHAAVVSMSGYRHSAVRLARANSVALLTHVELADIDRFIRC